MNPNSSATRALAAFLFLVPTIAAQPANETAPRRADTPTLDVRFNGGTLVDLVQLLRVQNDMINIVAPELAARVPVPPMQLHSVTAEAALRAAAMVVDKPFELTVQPINEKTGGAVLALRVQERTMRMAATSVGLVDPDETRVEVFSLRAITKALPNEPDGIVHQTKTVLTAIDTGLGFVRAAANPSIKFHEDSGLLFVSATNEQIQVVTSVLNQLEGSVAAARAEAARAEAVRQSRGNTSTEAKHPGEAKDPAEAKKSIR